MSDFDFLYIFFVRTGQERKALMEIQSAFDEPETACSIPTVETLFRNQGMVRKEISLLFPGYVFLESPVRNTEFWNRAKKMSRGSTHILRPLCYGDTNLAAVHEEEREVLDRLWPRNHCIEVSKGVIVGDRVMITEGSLIGFESFIKAINRHKMQAVIELAFMGEKRLVTVGLEILEKLV